MKTKGLAVGLFLIAFTWIGTALGTPLDLWYPRLTNSVLAVAYGGGNFVAVGSSGTVACSTNGGSYWTASQPTTNTLQDVAYGQEKFVAVGANGTVMVSSNGVSWENRSPGTNLFLQKIYYGNDRFVAIGYTVSLVSISCTLVSTDAINWTAYFLDSAKPNGQLTFGNNLFLHALNGPSNLLSSDGVNWWQQPTPMTNSLYTICFAKDLFVAFDITSRVHVSADATNWTLFGTNTLTRPEALAYGNGFWLGASRSSAGYSTDLKHWTLIPSRTGYDVCYGNGTFILVANTIQQSAPIVQLQFDPMSNALNFSGPTGIVYRVEALSDLGAPWQTITNLVPDTSPYLWTDPDVSLPQKFYRVVLP